MVGCVLRKLRALAPEGEKRNSAGGPWRPRGDRGPRFGGERGRRCAMGGSGREAQGAPKRSPSRSPSSLTPHFSSWGPLELLASTPQSGRKAVLTGLGAAGWSPLALLAAARIARLLGPGARTQQERSGSSATPTRGEHLRPPLQGDCGGQLAAARDRSPSRGRLMPAVCPRRWRATRATESGPRPPARPVGGLWREGRQRVRA
jgi:hypothetical protein